MAEPWQRFKTRCPTPRSGPGHPWSSSARRYRDLEAAAHALVELDARLADLFAVEQDGRILIRLVHALDWAGGYVIVTSPAPDDGEYAQLSDIAPAAFTEECEIYEHYGIRPAGGKPLNRVVMPPHAEAEFPLRAGRRHAEPARSRASLRPGRGVRVPVRPGTSRGMGIAVHGPRHHGRGGA